MGEEIRLIFKILLFTIILCGWLYRKINNKEGEE